MAYDYTLEEVREAEANGRPTDERHFGPSTRVPLTELSTLAHVTPYVFDGDGQHAVDEIQSEINVVIDYINSLVTAIRRNP